MTFKKQSLSSQLIDSLTNQQQPEKVYKLNATSQNIKQIQPSIKKYNRLRCLILDFNYLDRMDNLNALFDLRQLHMEGNCITRVQGLQTCKNLTVLNLGSNQIEKIEKISHLGKLQNLNFSNNKIEKISSLQTLKQLKVLNLSFNSLVSVDSLPSFSKLQTLLLSNNAIQKISANIFSSSMKLIKLDLSSNCVKDCLFVSKLTNIQSLNLQNNRIQTFSLQTRLKFLQQLSLQNNQLQRIPPIGEFFPQLVLLNINKNMFCSEHQLISTLSDNQMLTEIYFEDNPLNTESFQNTLYQLFKFERINKRSYNLPGSKYMQAIKQIEQTFKTVQFKDLQDDQQDRKLKMSGFYNDQLQNRMTGIKPHRAVSPATKKARNMLSGDNMGQIERNFNEFIVNDKRIKCLREVYERICSQNQIQKPIIPAIDENIYLTEQNNGPFLPEKVLSSHQILGQLRTRNHDSKSVVSDQKKQKEAKWAQLKARTKQKSFNIRKSRTKEFSGSLSKVSTQLPSRKVSSDLMKTQLNPRRPLNSAIVEPAGKTGTTFYRPSSQKKLPKNI